MEKDFEHIKHIMDVALKQNKKVNSAMRRLDTKEAVKKLLGETLMTYVSDIYIYKDTLIISTSESVLRQELLAQEDNILKSICEQMPDITLSRIQVKV